MRKAYKEQSQALEQSRVGKALLKNYVKYTINELFQRWHDYHKSSNNSNLRETKPNSISTVHDKPTKNNNPWVWLQGFVVDITNDGDIFQISDNPRAEKSFIPPKSPRVLIINCNKTPGEIKSSAKGKYFQGKSNQI